MDFWRRRHDPGVLFLFFDELFTHPQAVSCVSCVLCAVSCVLCLVCHVLCAMWLFTHPGLDPRVYVACICICRIFATYPGIGITFALDFA